MKKMRKFLIGRYLMSAIPIRATLPDGWGLYGIIISLIMMTLLCWIWVEWMWAIGLGISYAISVWLFSRFTINIFSARIIFWVGKLFRFDWEKFYRHSDQK